LSEEGRLRPTTANFRWIVRAFGNPHSSFAQFTPTPSNQFVGTCVGMSSAHCWYRNKPDQKRCRSRMQLVAQQSQPQKSENYLIAADCNFGSNRTDQSSGAWPIATPESKRFCLSDPIQPSRYRTPAQAATDSIATSLR
jgi:hypothetical protein